MDPSLMIALYGKLVKVWDCLLNRFREDKFRRNTRKEKIKNMRLETLYKSLANSHPDILKLRRGNSYDGKD